MPDQTVPGLDRFLANIALERCGPLHAAVFLHPQTLQVSTTPQPKPWLPLRMEPGKRPKVEKTVAEYLTARIGEAVAAAQQRTQAKAQAQVEQQKAEEARRAQAALAAELDAPETDKPAPEVQP